jgi:hypothetical protein
MGGALASTRVTEHHLMVLIIWEVMPLKMALPFTKISKISTVNGVSMKKNDVFFREKLGFFLSIIHTLV